MTSARYTTTSTIVCADERAMLVDPAWTVAELESIVDWLAGTGHAAASGFSTHAHHDHLLWHPRFGDVPRWASTASVACARQWNAELRAALDDDYLALDPDPFTTIRPVTDVYVPEPFGSDRLAEPVELIVHDGHAPGHTALWLPDRGAFLAGDMLSDIELPLPFHPDDLPAYLAALDAVAPAVARATVLVPGHGHPTFRPLERLDADRAYLDAVIRGEDPADPRRGNDGMAEAHDRIVALARTMR